MLSFCSATCSSIITLYLQIETLHRGVCAQQVGIEEVDAQPSAAPAPPSAQLAGVDAAALEATILHTVRGALRCAL